MAQFGQTETSATTTASEAGRGEAEWRLPAGDTSAAPPEEVTEVPLWATQFEARVNATYHLDREAFLALVARGAAAVSVLLGSGAAALAVGQSGYAVWCALGVAFAGTINLVFAPAQLARDSRDLRRRYLDLMVKIESGELTEPVRARSEFLKITVDAPPTCLAARAIARNRVVRSLYPAEEVDAHLLVVPKWDQWTAFVFRRPDQDYRPKPKT